MHNPKVLAMLVTEKVPQIANEIAQLLSRGEDEPGYLWVPLWEWHDNPPEALPEVCAKIVLVVCEISIEFDRRVTSQIDKYPQKLIWLVHKAPRECCERRKRVLEEMISASGPQDLDGDVTSHWLIGLPASSIRSFSFVQLQLFIRHLRISVISGRIVTMRWGQGTGGKAFH